MFKYYVTVQYTDAKGNWGCIAELHSFPTIENADLLYKKECKSALGFVGYETSGSGAIVKLVRETLESGNKTCTSQIMLTNQFVG